VLESRTNDSNVLFNWGLAVYKMGKKKTSDKKIGEARELLRDAIVKFERCYTLDPKNFGIVMTWANALSVMAISKKVFSRNYFSRNQKKFAKKLISKN
jgi:hypothetical protein